MILRLTENVPDVYVNESRDFQLICRLFDCSNQETKFNILTMLNAYTPTKFSNRMLHLLADRVGFKTKHYIDDKVLRYIIAAFPYIIKNKGSQKGIEQAVNTILKAENSLESPYVNIDEGGVVIITTPITIFNKIALEELLNYVMPTGYYYSLNSGSLAPKLNTGLTTDAGGIGVITPTSNSDDNVMGIIRTENSIDNIDNKYYKYYSSTTESKVYSKINSDGNENRLLNDYIGAVGTTVVTKLKGNNNNE